MRLFAKRAAVFALVALGTVACRPSGGFNERCFPACDDGLVCHGRPARCGLAAGRCLTDGDCASAKRCSFVRSESIGTCV